MKYLDIYKKKFIFDKTYDGWKSEVKNSIGHDHESLNWVVGWQRVECPIVCQQLVTVSASPLSAISRLSIIYQSGPGWAGTPDPVITPPTLV